jgi:quinoprotein glucose dehydrogenase
MGHTNVWAPFTVDTARGLVFLPVSTPRNDWYGGARLGDNLYAESVVCLDARSGRRVWHFQAVHHGVWDYDLPAPPALVTLREGRGSRDLVVVPTKMGYLYVFDRMTGAPRWPIVEDSVPASDVPGERLSRTQPRPTLPLPFARQGLSEDDIIDFTPALRRQALEVLRRYRAGPLWTPPSLQGTIAMPGNIGGSGWGGAAYDPESGTVYVKATNSPTLYKLVRPERSDSLDAEFALDFAAAVSVRATLQWDSSGLHTPPADLPINKPPYGTLTAIDLHTGRQRWQVTLGDTPWLRDHPALRGVALPPLLGVAGAPGPIVTAGGLVFVTGGGDRLYAIDKDTGATLWSAPLSQRGYAVPMTYSSGGRQFVAIATGAGAGARLAVFALPER